MSVRLVVTDDHPIMRQALAGYFSRVEEMEVVGQATNGREAVELVDQLLPDVVLMDLKMPEMDGLTATRMIVSRHPSVRVVALTTFARRDIVVEAILAGLMADGVRLVLLSARVPHAIVPGPLVEEDVRAHHRHLLPGLGRREGGLVALTLPRLAVLAGGVADP